MQGDLSDGGDTFAIHQDRYYSITIALNVGSPFHVFRI